MSQQFDEKAVNTELDRLFAEVNIDYWDYTNWSEYFARWQFNRDRDAIEKLEAKYDGLFHKYSCQVTKLLADKAKLAEIIELLADSFDNYKQFGGTNIWLDIETARKTLAEMGIENV